MVISNLWYLDVKFGLQSFKTLCYQACHMTFANSKGSFEYMKLYCWVLLTTSRPPLSSDIIIFTDRPELKAKGERIIFEDREVKKRKFSLRETALFNPDPILAKISRILTENWIIPVNWPFFHRFCAPMAYFRWILDDIDVSYPFATFYIQKNWFLGPKGQNLEIFKIFN